MDIDLKVCYDSTVSVLQEKGARTGIDADDLNAFSLQAYILKPDIYFSFTTIVIVLADLLLPLSLWQPSHLRVKAY